MREHDLPVWGRERPSSLLVISYDVNKNVKLVSDDSTPDLVDALDVASIRHAVPVLFPLMDLEDISVISIEDVASGQFNRIGALASRYSPDALVVGKIVGRSEEGWFGDWEVRFAEQIFTWQYQAASRQEVLDQVIRHLARVLALEYALEDHRRVEQSLLLRVSGMNEIGHLNRVKQYLQSLNVVERVRIAAVKEGVVTYELQLRNEASDLQRLIEFGEVLEQEDFPQVSTQGKSQATLSYGYIDSGVGN